MRSKTLQYLVILHCLICLDLVPNTLPKSGRGHATGSLIQEQSLTVTGGVRAWNRPEESETPTSMVRSYYSHPTREYDSNVDQAWHSRGGEAKSFYRLQRRWKWVQHAQEAYMLRASRKDKVGKGRVVVRRGTAEDCSN